MGLFENRAKAFCARFGVREPVMNAPMAGVTTPAMAAAVSEAGGLGVIAADAMTLEELEAAVAFVRSRTRNPFAVHVRVNDTAKTEGAPDAQASAVVDEMLADLCAELGVTAPLEPAGLQDVIDFVIRERVPVLAVSFGGLREAQAEALEAHGIAVIGTATTLREAKVLRSSGVAAIAVQGVEAGGPRANFEAPDSDPHPSLFSLIGPAARATGLPVIAAGGIMTGEDVAAALAAGASGVMLGSALLLSDESGAVPAHREAVRWMTDTSGRRSAVTAGRLTRLLASPLTQVLEEAELPREGYPAQWKRFAAIERAARAQGREDLLTYAAGECAMLARAEPSQCTVRRLMQGARDVLSQ